mgnify:CR=1 FL=1
MNKAEIMLSVVKHLIDNQDSILDNKIKFIVKASQTRGKRGRPKKITS